VQRTAKLTISASLLAAILLSLAACSNSGSTDNKNSLVAATVNGKQIINAEVEKLISQQTQGQQDKLSSLQLAQARLQILDSLIQREVLFQRAEKEKLLPTEDQITTAINQQKQQSGMTDEDFQKWLSQRSMTQEALRDEARKDLSVSNLQEKYSGKIVISNHDVEEYYYNNREKFVIGKGVELANIVVDPRDNGLSDDAKNEAEAKLKIEGVYQQLKTVGTERFGEVALAKSEEQSRMGGGDIGFASEEDLKRSNFPAALITQLFGMQPGEFTQPVEFNGRWYVFKLKRKQMEIENRTLESPGVRQQITVELTDQRKQVLNSALLVVALSEAKIVNNLANQMLANPSNLGLRPASSSATATPATGSTATPQTAAPTITASPAAAAASPKPSASKQP